MKKKQSLFERFLSRVKPASFRRGFDAARINRLNSDWITGQTSLDYDLRWNLRVLIDRSRWSEQNNEYAEGYFKSAERNVIGPNPFVLQMKVYELDGRHDRLAEEIIEHSWKQWGKMRNCTLSESMTLFDVYRVTLRSILRDGGGLIRKHRGRNRGEYGFMLEPLDIDYLDCEYNDTLRNGNRIVMSVEIEPSGKVVAYHLLGDHPGELYARGNVFRTRVDAKDIIHAYVFKRPSNQHRGYTELASILPAMRQLHGYKEAEIVAARTAAAKMGFLEAAPGENVAYTGENAKQGGKYMDAEPGTMEQLPNGLTFKQFDPQHPTSQFGDFIKENLRGQATGLGQSYMTYANDASSANFSSARIGLVDEREGWKMLQRIMVEHVCEPIFEDWLFTALGFGAIKRGKFVLPVEKFEKFNNPYFQPRRWPWLDPRADVIAYEKALELGLTSPGRVIAESGSDEEEVLDEIGTTIDERAKLGLISKERIEAMRAGETASEETRAPLIASIGVGGLQALTQIMQQIGSGELKPQAAQKLLVVVFGFTEQEAKEITQNDT